MNLARDLGRHLALCALVCASGCAPIEAKKGESPLRAAHMSPDSVTLDLFFVRFPFGDAAVNQDLWREIDEQQIPLETRQRLMENGFRVGTVCGPIPRQIAQLLELTGKSGPAGAARVPLAEIGSDEGPMWSHTQLRAGKRSEIVTSEVYDDLPVLLAGPDGVGGKTYEQAQGKLGVRAIPEQDGRVSLEFVPELHYGELQKSFSGSQGAWQVKMVQPRRVFDDMAVSMRLAPGHMIVLSSLPDRAGSLGHHFLTSESSGRLEQKLLIIRLSQTQHDALFEPSPISLKELP